MCCLPDIFRIYCCCALLVCGSSAIIPVRADLYDVIRHDFVYHTAVPGTKVQTESTRGTAVQHTAMIPAGTRQQQVNCCVLRDTTEHVPAQENGLAGDRAISPRLRYCITVTCDQDAANCEEPGGGCIDTTERGQREREERCP